MLLDMHWLDEVRPPQVPLPKGHRRRPQRRRSPQGFLQPALAGLGSLVGRWDAEVDYHCGGFVHQDLRVRGTSDIRVGPDGQTMVMESHLSGWMGQTLAHTVLAADAATGNYRLFVADAFTPGCQRYTGWQPSSDCVVFEGAATLEGVSGRVRRTLRFSVNEQSWTVAFFTGGDTTRLITGRLRRRRAR